MDEYNEIPNIAIKRQKMVLYDLIPKQVRPSRYKYLIVKSLLLTFSPYLWFDKEWLELPYYQKLSLIITA